MKAFDLFAEAVEPLAESRTVHALRILSICLLLLGTRLPAAEAQLPGTSGVFLQFSDTEERVVSLEDLPEPNMATAQPTHPFDEKLVEQGKELFSQTCTECHDAERALDKRKTFADWMATVAEMAKQEDADIPQTSFLPIATYLASLGPPSKAEPMAGDDPSEEATRNEGKEDSAEEGQDASKPRFDPQEVARGQSAFQASCTKCHDAQRALSKRKSRAGWLATVRRMARMEDADIAAADIGPIATYLASLSAPSETDAAESGAEDSTTADYEAAVGDALGLGAGLNVSGTLSTLWRGGNDNLENPNFFTDTWVRLDWQPDGPLRARVTACTSCHSDQTNGGGFTLELVEASAHFDLLHGFRAKDQRPESCKTAIEAEVKAGRFVVPFGAYHAMSHPGIYRTVTNPLMFNMGRQVNASGSRPPVLPMPYSDEGVGLHAMVPLRGEWKVNLDGFAVNGLRGGGSGVNFTRSRSYADNNRHAGYGGRATIGNKQVRVGGSVMAGRLEDEGASTLNYHLAGADATARFYDDLVRLYFEYAIRRNDSVFGQRQISYGIVSELEVLLWERPNLSALLRYDTLEHRDFFGESSIERFTWGVSTTIAGSLVILNHEHWNFPTDEIADVDVLGIRWVATF